MALQLKKKVALYWLPSLSGIFIGTSYIPFPPWAALFGFVPLWLWMWRQDSLRRIAWGGWVTQFILTVIGFNWVAHTVAEFGHLPWPAALVTLALFASFANLHVPLAGILWHVIVGKRRNLAAAILLPACTAALELVYPMIFDWHFGYTWLWIHWPAYHLAEIMGFKALSTITIFLNLFIFWSLVELPGLRQGPQIKRLTFGLVGLAFSLAILTFAGLWLRNHAPATDRVANILMVQANIGNAEKQEAEKGERFRDAIIDQYLDLSSEGLKTSPPTSPIHFLIWPETAFPHLLSEPHIYSSVYASRVRGFLVERKQNLVTGGYGYRDALAQPTNSIFFLNDQGLLADSPYDKTRLLAFGEYFPGATFFPKLKVWFPEVADFARGPGPQMKRLGSLKIGPLICYEGLFDDFGRRLAQLDSQILVNITNDSWYGTWQEPYQHLYMTLARGVEVRRPIVRSTNTGISTVGLADGTVLTQSPLQKTWTHLYEVPYYENPTKTVFMGTGYYAPWLILALAFLAAGLGLKRERTAKPRLD